jgi:hypothetical protein
MSLHPGLTYKTAVAIQPQAIVDADDPVGAYGDANPVSIDTSGFNKVKVCVAIGATDIAATALAVYTGDAAASGADDSTDNWAKISGAEFTGSDLPSATDDNKLFTIYLTRSQMRRYIAVDVTAGDGSAGTFVTAWVDLHDADGSLTTAAERGNAGGEVIL